MVIIKWKMKRNIFASTLANFILWSLSLNTASSINLSYFTHTIHCAPTAFSVHNYCYFWPVVFPCGSWLLCLQLGPHEGSVGQGVRAIQKLTRARNNFPRSLMETSHLPKLPHSWTNHLKVRALAGTGAEAQPPFVSGLPEDDTDTGQIWSCVWEKRWGCFDRQSVISTASILKRAVGTKNFSFICYSGYCYILLFAFLWSELLKIYTYLLHCLFNH